MNLTLEQMKAQGEELQRSIEAKVKSLVENGVAEGNAAIQAIKAELDGTKKSLATIDENIRQAKAGTLPGLKGEMEKRSFDFGKFVQGVRGIVVDHGNAKDSFEAAGAGFEHEVLSQYAKIRDASADVGPSGGYVIPPEISQEIIGLAFARMPLLKMGTTVISGLTGDLAVNRLSARPTGYHVGETGKPASSDVAFAQKWLRPKKVGAFTKISNRLINQSRGVAGRVIKEELAMGMAQEMHRALTVGKGSEFEPLGIFNTPGTTSSSVTEGSAGHRFTIDDCSMMIADIEAANELIDGGKFGFLMHPAVRSGLRRERAEMYSSQSSVKGMPMGYMPIMTNEMLNSMLYPIETTTHISKYTKSTSTTCSKVAFGNMAFFYIGMWRDLVIKVSDVAGDGSTGSAFTEDQLYVVAFQEYDCQHVRPTALSIAIGAETLQSKW